MCFECGQRGHYGYDCVNRMNKIRRGEYKDVSLSPFVIFVTNVTYQQLSPVNKCQKSMILGPKRPWITNLWRLFTVTIAHTISCSLQKLLKVKITKSKSDFWEKKDRYRRTTGQKSERYRTRRGNKNKTKIEKYPKHKKFVETLKSLKLPYRNILKYF